MLLDSWQNVGLSTQAASNLLCLLLDEWPLQKVSSRQRAGPCTPLTFASLREAHMLQGVGDTMSARAAR